LGGEPKVKRKKYELRIGAAKRRSIRFKSASVGANRRLNKNRFFGRALLLLRRPNFYLFNFQVRGDELES
jgi:hypothetical protein